MRELVPEPAPHAAAGWSLIEPLTTGPSVQGEKSRQQELTAPAFSSRFQQNRGTGVPVQPCTLTAYQVAPASCRLEGVSPSERRARTPAGQPPGRRRYIAISSDDKCRWPDRRKFPPTPSSSPTGLGADGWSCPHRPPGRTFRWPAHLPRSTRPRPRPRSEERRV